MKLPLKNKIQNLISFYFNSKDAARKSILYSYKHGFSGFAAVLSQPQARLIAGNFQVESISKVGICESIAKCFLCK